MILVSNGSGNGLLVIESLTINWTTDGLWSIEPLRTNIKRNLYQNTSIFIEEYVIQNAVCYMPAMLFSPQCVNLLRHDEYIQNCVKVHGANMGPIGGRQDPGGPHVGPMNLAIWLSCLQRLNIGGPFY